MSNMIDLSRLPPPAFVETLDVEAIFAEMLADVRQRAAAKGIDFNTISEADPAYIVLEVAAYRELLVRQRGNDEGKALLLAFATGADLDHLGITYYDREPRLLIAPADPLATPPTAAVHEDDVSYKRRLLLKDASYSTAGATASYQFHALSADGRVRDVAVASPRPGTTVVYVLSRHGDGTPAADLLAKVDARLNHLDVRPLSEAVLTRPAAIVRWILDADLYVCAGPDATLVYQAAEDSVDSNILNKKGMQSSITIDAIYAALRVPGVAKIVLRSPSDDVLCRINEAQACIDVSIHRAGVWTNG